MIRLVAAMALTWLCAMALGDPGAAEATAADAPDLKRVDPALRAQRLAQLRAQLAAQGVPRATGALRVHADRSESMRVGADHAAIIVARIKADGTLQTQCVHGARAAADWLATAPSARTDATE